jgi:hypothetical protein
MIVVRVELWPGGDPRPLHQIAILAIVNVGRERRGFHAYEARAEGRMVRLRHRQSDGPLILVAKAIRALGKATEPDPLAQVDVDLVRALEAWSLEGREPRPEPREGAR